MKQNIFQTPYLLFLLLLLLTSSLGGCQLNPTSPSNPETSKLTQPLLHAYDYRIVNSETQTYLSVDQLAKQLVDYDVIVIGEFHGNHASHLLEMQLINALYPLRDNQVISLEMFNRDQQPILNRYIDGEIGEVYLIRKAPAWNNYAASYRPIVEFAKQNLTPVVAANAPADIIRCIGKEGQSYLAKLSDDETKLIAQSPFIDNEQYRKAYMELMQEARSFTEERKENSYMAQLTRDNTMAESILTAKQDNPEAQIIHLNGSFHSDSFLGTVAALKARQPELKIAVITPIAVEDPQNPSYSAEDLATGTYLYLIPELPEQYVDASFRRELHQSMYKKSRSKAESCK